MTELTGTPVRPSIEVAPGDDAQADAATDGDCDGMVKASSESIKALGDRKRVDVVVHEHRNAESGAENGCHRKVGPAQHRCLDDAVHVDDARNAEPHPQQPPWIGRGVVDGCCQPLGEALDKIWLGRFEWLQLTCEYGPVQGNTYQREVVSRDLDTDRLRRASHEPEQDRTAPTTR